MRPAILFLGVKPEPIAALFRNLLSETRVPSAFIDSLKSEARCSSRKHPSDFGKVLDRLNLRRFIKLSDLHAIDLSYLTY